MDRKELYASVTAHVRYPREDGRLCRAFPFQEVGLIVARLRRHTQTISTGLGEGCPR